MKDDDMPDAPFGLYLHIPFCAVRCGYCDFNTYAGLEHLFEPFATALAAEIRAAGASRGRPPAATVYMGGGTPTVLPPTLLGVALAACRDAFDLSPDAEISCEANPGTVDASRFAALRGLGVNRLSIGVQSFDDAELRWLGRIHTAAEAIQAFRAARASGFADLSLDLIFGLPGQARATWRRTLDRAVDLGPEHLSLYSLTVEPGTPLADRVRRGQVPSPDDDLAAELYEQACDLLDRAGYEQYEISNWAKNERAKTKDERPRTKAQPPAPAPVQLRASSVQPPASSTQPPASIHRSRHNLIYWRHEPYLGFGPGAHSFEWNATGDGGWRWWNVRPVPDYIERIAGGRSPRQDGENIDRRTAMGEFMMLGLRLVQEGVTDARFRGRFGEELEQACAAEIAALVGRGLLERLPDRVRLSPQGRLLGNQVFAAFVG